MPPITFDTSDRCPGSRPPSPARRPLTLRLTPTPSPLPGLTAFPIPSHFRGTSLSTPPPHSITQWRATTL